MRTYNEMSESINKPITRCVCYDVSFLQLKKSSLETVDEIARQYGCTTGCGLCRTYIERMLATGETAFHIE